MLSYHKKRLRLCADDGELTPRNVRCPYVILDKIQVKSCFEDSKLVNRSVSMYKDNRRMLCMLSVDDFSVVNSIASGNVRNSYIAMSPSSISNMFQDNLNDN